MPSRRSFLAASSLAALGALTRATPLRGDTAAPSGRIALGIIGLGSMGAAHLSGLVWENRVDIVALCDTDRVRLAAGRHRVEAAYGTQTRSGRWRGVATTGDWREVVASPRVDAVLIALPDHWHALPFVEAARAGKDIYAEKPLSLTIPEGQAMVRAVKAHGTVCQIGSQQRSSSEFQRVVELARNGFLGRVERVEVGLPGGAGPELAAPMAAQKPPPTLDYEMWLGPAPWAPYFAERCHWNFRWIYDYSGGQLSDWIGHHFDIGAWAAGVSGTGPALIRGASASFGRGPLYDTAADYAFEAVYPEGFVFSVGSRNRHGVKVIGTEGWVWATRGGIEFSDPRLRHVAPAADGFRAGDGTGHFGNFLDCVATRRNPRCPVEEAHRVVTVAHLANLAFRTGRSELRWDAAAERLVDAPDAQRLLARAYRAPWHLPA